jgi:hypothetical protein
MVRISYGVDNKNIEDSALVKNGKYQFKGKITEPRMAYFSVTYAHDSIKQKWPRDFFTVFNNEVAKLYGINAIPRNMLINPEGIIIATDLRGEELEHKLEEILK